MNVHRLYEFKFAFNRILQNNFIYYFLNLFIEYFLSEYFFLKFNLIYMETQYIDKLSYID